MKPASIQTSKTSNSTTFEPLKDGNNQSNNLIVKKSGNFCYISAYRKILKDYLLNQISQLYTENKSEIRKRNRLTELTIISVPRTSMRCFPDFLHF